MNDDECPFCEIANANSKEKLIAESDYAIAFLDKYPLNEGHTLVVPRRHESDFFNLTIEEQMGLWRLLSEVQKVTTSSLKPDGFNVGINVSKSAGQTVDHAHVHLIPRFNGDVDNPKGGVRWVIPEKAPYWGEEVTLVEALKKKTTSTIEAISRFHTPGWTYQGCCYQAECFSCSEMGLDIWRRPINPEYDNSYRYWGVFCRKCESLTDLSCYKAPQKKLLRKWASETETPFHFTGEWTPEADKALLQAYQSGRSIPSIAEDFGVAKTNKALSDRLGNFLLFNKDFPIPFTREPLQEKDSLKLELDSIWESCSQMPAREKTKVITNGICQWTEARGWSPSEEERIDIHPEICNSGRNSRRGRVDVWCEPNLHVDKGLAIEIDGHDKVISISKLIQAGINGYIPIWVRHTTPVKIDVPEQIHLISLNN